MKNVIKYYNILLKYRAYIVKPDGEVDILDLFDDGNIPDGNQNDGEYSRYFTNTTQKGRYTVQCQIINSGTALQSDGFIGSASPRFSSKLSLIIVKD